MIDRRNILTGEGDTAAVLASDDRGRGVSHSFSVRHQVREKSRWDMDADHNGFWPGVGLLWLELMRQRFVNINRIGAFGYRYLQNKHMSCVREGGGNMTHKRNINGSGCCISWPQARCLHSTIFNKEKQKSKQQHCFCPQGPCPECIPYLKKNQQKISNRPTLCRMLTHATLSWLRPFVSFSCRYVA